MQTSTWIGGFKIHLNSPETEDPKVRAIAKNTWVEENLKIELMSWVAESLQWCPVGTAVWPDWSVVMEKERQLLPPSPPQSGRQGRDRKVH